VNNLLPYKKQLLLENINRSLMYRHTLKRALNLSKGKGALICVLIECPYCKNDIWVECGHHTGDGGTQDNFVKDNCYECCSFFKLHIQGKEKDTAFFTISEYTDFRTRGFVFNFKRQQKEAMPIKHKK
jgi:hypothetical protein